MSPEQRTVIEVDGRQLSVSNLDKVLYPEAGFTKADVIWYYVHVAPVLLPHCAGTAADDDPVPRRGHGQVLFREAQRSQGTRVGPLRPRAAKSTVATELGFIEQIVIDDLATLVWVANLAALELHVPQWRSVSDGTYGPVDLIVFDLDPGAPATIVECCAVAGWLRVELESRGLVALPKTSGSKGLQLYARLDPPRPWEQAHGQAREIAQLMEREHPGHVLSNMRRDLRQGKVLIDWSQNHAAKTTIAPYSLRALAVPTVSTPLTWDEVQQGAEGGGDRLAFLAPEVLERVESVGDLFAPLTGRSRGTPTRRAPAPRARRGPKSKTEDVRGVRRTVSALVLAPGAECRPGPERPCRDRRRLGPKACGSSASTSRTGSRGAGRPIASRCSWRSVVAAARRLADDLAVPQAEDRPRGPLDGRAHVLDRGGRGSPGCGARARRAIRCIRQASLTSSGSSTSGRSRCPACSFLGPVISSPRPTSSRRPRLRSPAR